MIPKKGVLSAVFRIADDQGMLLIDFKDLKAMIGYVSEHAAEFKAEYGNLSPCKPWRDSTEFIGTG